MKSTPHISVIMSAYNSENTVYDSVQSILNQTFTDFEFLIADDGSRDNTKHILNQISDRRIRIINNDQNIGLLKTWNKLIAEAKGKYIIFQDADDISFNNRLEKLHNFMESNPNVAVCGANFIRRYPRFNQISVSNYPLSHEEILKKVDCEKVVPFIRGIFKRDVVNEMGCFRLFFERVGWEDFDLFLRIAEKYEVRNISDVLYDYVYSSNSSSKLKISSSTFLNVFINDIGLFLRNQRVNNNGKDGLSSSGLKAELNNFLEIKQNEFSKNPTILHNKIALNQISNKDYGNAIYTLYKALLLKPYSLDIFKTVFRLFLSCFKSGIYKITKSNKYDY